MHRFLRDHACAILAVVTLGAALRDTDLAQPVPAPIPISTPEPAVDGAPPALAPLPPEDAPSMPRRVVIISEDGLRPDVLSPELTPRHIQLMREGTTARQAETIPESDTLPSHASMLSGVGAAAHGLWWNSYQAARGYIQVPTVFSAAHASGLSTAMIVGKPKLRHIAIPGTVDHFARPSYLCSGVAKYAAEYFVKHKPDLLFVHFSDPDESGHSHGWVSPDYLRAAHASDACLDTMLAAIDGSGVAGTTLVIVTADHGGHGKHHSNGRMAVDRDIPWIVRGPGVAHGGVLEDRIATVDTAATALAALGLPALPHMRGAARLVFTR